MPYQPNKQKKAVRAVIDVIAALLVLALIGLVLTGCGTQVVYVPQYVVVSPPDALLLDCRKDAPPDIDWYIEQSWNEKEKALVSLNNKNYGNLDVCNLGKSELREWKKDQLLIYEAKNKAAKSKAGGK